MADDDRLAQVGADDNPVLVYTTCPTKEVAKRIGGELVRNRLVACANILPAMQSIYVWQEALHEDDEVVMLLKTRRTLAARIVVEIERLHPYDTPAVLVIPIDGGSQPFMDWIGANTA
jgi:periplasmic divalent cation tolerance protein